MTVDRFIMMFAGVVVMLGVGLGAFVNSWFLLIPFLVGLNLFQASFTRFCLGAKILLWLGVAPGNIFR